MEGILWEQTLASLKVVPWVVLLFGTIIGVVMLFQYFRVWKRQKKNCFDCKYMNRHHENAIICTAPRSAMDTTVNGPRPIAYIKDGAVYVECGTWSVAMTMRCSAWIWDMNTKNLKYTMQELMNKGG